MTPAPQRPQAPSAEPAKAPTIEVTRVGKAASGLVFLICVFSLITWAVDGFYIVEPIISGFLVALAVSFYVINAWMERQWKS